MAGAIWRIGIALDPIIKTHLVSRPSSENRLVKPPAFFVAANSNRVMADIKLFGEL